VLAAIINNAFCTILSFDDAIPSGLIFPLALGMNTLLVGLGEYFLFCSSLLREIIEASKIYLALAQSIQ